MRVGFLFLTLLVCWLTPAIAAEPKFELRDGDRVVFVGNTFTEREQKYGYLETLLACGAPDRNVTFRNLGWSGDTVWGQARAMFGKPEDGFKNLVKHLGELKPTVIFVAYGMNESFDGEKGLPQFKEGLARMLEMLGKTGARQIVLLSPIQHEVLDGFPDPAAHNEQLKAYSAAIADAAKARGHFFVDLFKNLFPTAPLTENGIHLSPQGYRRIGEIILEQLGRPLRYKDAGPVEKMRALINEKNQLYFHRWRPQNDTYIFGFRKPEQGRNAVEIPQFDPLVAEKESQIAALRAAAAQALR